MNTDKASPELFSALAKAQAEVENASKNAANPHFRSRYADLAEVLNTVRPVLSKHGIAVLQSTEFDGATVSVSTALCHSSGGVVTSTASCVPAKTDAQGIGSATTYLRRYSLAAMCGVAQEDDDGQSAAHSGKPAPVAKVAPTAGVWEALTDTQREKLESIAATIREYLECDDAQGAIEHLENCALDTDQKAALWTRFDSKQRSALKKAHGMKAAA